MIYHVCYSFLRAVSKIWTGDGDRHTVLGDVDKEYLPEVRYAVIESFVVLVYASTLDFFLSFSHVFCFGMVCSMYIAHPTQRSRRNLLRTAASLGSTSSIAVVGCSSILILIIDVYMHTMSLTLTTCAIYLE